MDFCGLSLDSPFFLAPMAGITDSAFRTICREMGAALCYTEMASAKALVYGDKKSREIITIDESHRPCAVQIFGSDPAIMAEAARIAAEGSAPDFIDINMGCPMPKIVNNGEGAALMKDVKAAMAVVAAVKNAISLPVTVKFRAGYFEHENIAADFARAMEAAGADGLCLHGRTRHQLYGGKSRRDVIFDAKRAVSIPLIASGDAMTPRECMDILAETGADGVMIARGSLGNPFIFDRCNCLFRGQEPRAITIEAFVATMNRHAALTCRLKGEKRAMAELRKHALWYMGRVKGAKPLKARMSHVATLPEFYEITRELLSFSLKLN